MQEFEPKGDQKFLSDIAEPGRSIMAIRTGGAIVPAKSFRNNDRLDIYAVSQRGETKVVARDARFLGSMKAPVEQRPTNALADMVASASPKRGNGGGIVALVLSLRQQDLDAVASAQGSGSRLAFALHGVNEPPYVPVAALPPAEAPTVDLIMGKKREKVNVIQ
jgi:hypothetical protein